MTLSPTVMLDIRLSTICSTHRYTRDPAPVVEELRAVAGPRTDVLAEVAGLWAGYYEGDPDCGVLAAALGTLPGAEKWIMVGRYRRGIPNSGATPLPHRPAS